MSLTEKALLVSLETSWRIPLVEELAEHFVTAICVVAATPLIVCKIFSRLQLEKRA
jgi:hypothetical protein